MAMLNIRLDDGLDLRLSREAERGSLTRSELAREAISEYLSKREQQRFQSEIVRAARVRGAREAIALAEEAIVTGNEAFNTGEAVEAKYRSNRRPRR